jgi:immune inhibitor A
VGPLTLPQNTAYYCGKNNTGYEDRFTDFCRDALELAKDIVSDWSIYDNDKDDRIELVCVIFAGYGQNQGGADSSIWAKASYQNIKVNDTQRISRFNCCPELFHPQYPDYINGTGVFIHEFSHCMGLPDLYATTSTAYVNNQGMETFSIMDYGLYNRNGFAPCPYNAWEQEVMGWTKIEELKPTAYSQQQVSDLLPLIEGGKAYKLVNADNDRDYIVMENIQKRGLNTYSAAHGLLVYHVDYPYNTVNMTDAPNSNPGHPGVAVVPANGTLISSYLRGSGKKYTNEEWKESLSSSVFPGPENVTALTSQMQLPNYCFWNSSKAKETNYMLNSISENEGTGTVSFIVASDNTSSIDDVRWLKPDDSHVVYDLQGRRIQGCLKPGIFIVDGKKIYVK